jgi:hypothetical protein
LPRLIRNVSAFNINTVYKYSMRQQQFYVQAPAPSYPVPHPAREAGPVDFFAAAGLNDEVSYDAEAVAISKRVRPGPVSGRKYIVTIGKNWKTRKPSITVRSPMCAASAPPRNGEMNAPK